MAGYDYQRGGYANRNGWDTRTDDWSQTNYSGNGNSDHVYPPVIVDAQGKERPISESYVTQTETVIERVQVPAVTEYKYISPTEVESFSNYRVENEEFVPKHVPKFTPEVSLPTRPDLRPTYWRDTPNFIGYNGKAGYGGYKNFNNSEKPDNYYRRRNNTFTNPNLNNKDGQDRPDSMGCPMHPHWHICGVPEGSYYILWRDN